MTSAHPQSIHAQGVGIIAFTQMWESFSYFGMRALLVLYLVQSVGFSPQDAVILYMLYVAFVQLFATVGGYLVDRFLGYRRAVLLGGAVITVGHLLLSLSEFLYLSLGCIVCGASLFRVGLHTLLGLLYEKEDPRREKGFTLLYVGMNVGGVLAAILCGIVAEVYGWHAGFGLAAFGMCVGMAIFVKKCRVLDGLEPDKTSSCMLYVPLAVAASVALGALLCCFQEVHSVALPIGLAALLIIISKINPAVRRSVTYALFLLIAFFTAEELWGTLVMLFTEEKIQRSLFGVEIPSAALSAMNPLTIMLAGPLLAKSRLGFQTKLSLSFLLLSVGYIVLYIASCVTLPSILYLLTGLFCIALGELFLAPTLMAHTSRLAPPDAGAMMMGAVTLALSLGSLLSGEVAKLPTSQETIFFLVAACSFAIFIVLLVSRRNKKYNINLTIEEK